MKRSLHKVLVAIKPVTVLMTLWIQIQMDNALVPGASLLKRKIFAADPNLKPQWNNVQISKRMDFSVLRKINANPKHYLSGEHFPGQKIPSVTHQQMYVAMSMT